MRFMLCKTGNREILKSKHYIFEPKLDGTRALIFIDKKKKVFRIINRRNREISYRYPEFNFFNNVKESCILDGEIVVFNEKGLPDFNLLQQREQTENKIEIKIKSKTIPACFVVFDILKLKEKDLRRLGLEKRKEILSKNVVKEDEYFKKIISYCDGIKLWKIVKKLKLEGVIAKRKNSIYREGRSEDWLKIKNFKSVDAIVIGFTKEKREISALALGLYKDGKIFYIGKVASGLDEDKIKTFLKIARKTKPFKVENLNAKINFVKPEIVAEIKYMEFTKKKELRVPIFLRFRFDKDVKECTLDELEE